MNNDYDNHFFRGQRNKRKQKKNLIRLHKNTPKIIHGNRYTPIHLITKMRTGSIRKFFLLFFVVVDDYDSFYLDNDNDDNTKTQHSTKIHKQTSTEIFFLHLTIEKKKSTQFGE